MSVDTTTEIFAGQIWSQYNFPFYTRYIVLTPNGFCLLSDPRSQGNTVCTALDGKWLYTKEELIEKFKSHNYSCDGQLKDKLCVRCYNL